MSAGGRLESRYCVKGYLPLLSGIESGRTCLLTPRLSILIVSKNWREEHEKMELTSLIVSIGGFAVSWIGILIAILQTRAARKEARLHGDISILLAVLITEVTGVQDKAKIRDWGDLILKKARELGSGTVLKEIHSILQDDRGGSRAKGSKHEC
jgi:hypothetical protein